MPKSSVLFRCDGSAGIGLGHVVRCLALADELSAVHHINSGFAMRQDRIAFEMVQARGYPVIAPDRGEAGDKYQWLRKAIDQVRATTLVLDVRDDLSCQQVQELQGILIVVLDDPSERRLAADLAFYPPVPQVRRLDWRGFGGQLYVGWEWVVLRRDLLAHRPTLPSRPPHKPPVVLVTMGGSDPAGLTLKAVEALDLLEDDFETLLVLGPAFAHHEVLRKLLAGVRRRFKVISNVTDLPGLMARVDLAVASFGVTAYELAALGVPAIYLCLSQDHAESASSLVEAGFGLSLGVFSQVSAERLAEAVGKFLLSGCNTDTVASQRLDRHSLDGLGAERIARILAGRSKSIHG